MKSLLAASAFLVLIGCTVSLTARSQVDVLDSMSLEIRKYNLWMDSLLNASASPSGSSNTGTPAKLGDKRDGGIVFWVDAGGKHGLIAHPGDLGIKKWEAAVAACQALGAGWHLATKDELNKLYQARHLNIVESFMMFQSSTEIDGEHVWKQSLTGGEQSPGRKTSAASTLAVRSF